MNRYSLGTTQVLVAGLLWGTSGTVASFFPPSASPLAIGAMRLAIGGLTLILILGITTKGAWFSPSTKIHPKHVIIAAVGIATTQSMIFVGVKLAGVTIATMVFIGSAPLFSGIFSWIWHREVQKLSWLVSSSIVIIGCFLMGISGDSNVHGLDILKGSASALLAGAGWALAGTIIQEMQKSASSLEITVVVLTSGAILLFPLAALQGFSWIIEPYGIELVLALGLFVTAIPYFLFNAGMKHIPVPHAYLYGLIEPLMASMLGMLLLKERLSLIGTIGYLLVSGGLLLFSIWELTALKGNAPHRLKFEN
jgi:DME family drug/metabolite transporter